jgi:hypothetical protein
VRLPLRPASSLQRDIPHQIAAAVTPTWRLTAASGDAGFTIVDERPASARRSKKVQYTVRVSAGGSAKLFEGTYNAPGDYLVEIPCPARRQYSTIFVEMTNEMGQHFEDSVAMSFNMHFYRALKWVLLTPFLTMTATLLLVKDMHVSMLPV